MEKSQVKPIHIGIIADGNRRWARANNLPTLEGHKKGLSVIEMLVKECAKAEIPYVTFYVFSTENWNRSEEEVSYLMKLFTTKITGLAEKMARNNVKLLFLSHRENLKPELLRVMTQAEEITAKSTGTTACFCFNYGGEQEIVDAANEALEQDGKITTETLASHLYHPEIPPCDIIVRTSGEERLSGFMLWRASYSEFLFLQKYFPEVSEDDVAQILDEYQKRNRRFGK